VAGGVLSLEISDNGRGLDAADLGKDRSFGIRGLHERADTVGGWVEVSSTPQGTTLILSVPLDQRSPMGGVDDVGAPIGSPHDPSTWGDL
jgi:signal transduction histidine kinase